MSVTHFNLSRFNQDFAIGKIGENAFERQCKMWDMAIIDKTPENKPFPDYDYVMQYQATKEKQDYPDIILPSPVSWEIKCDMGKTGNVPIQFYSSSKRNTPKQLSGMSCNAGIYRTKATLIAVFNPYDSLFYIAPIEQLKTYIENSPDIKKILANKHKPEQTGIALIPKRVWKEKLYILPYYADEYEEL